MAIRSYPCSFNDPIAGLTPAHPVRRTTDTTDSMRARMVFLSARLCCKKQEKAVGLGCDQDDRPRPSGGAHVTPATVSTAARARTGGSESNRALRLVHPHARTPA